MKKLCSFVIVILFSLCMFGQPQEKELSNTEKFYAKSGTLFEKSFVSIGELEGVKIQVMKITDLIDKKTSSGLRFEYEAYSKYGNSTKIAVLDPDEIDGLLKSVKILTTNVFPSTRQDYTEVIFRSRGGFEAGCYFVKNEWKAYLKLERFDKDSYVFLSTEEFSKILPLLEQAKQKL